MSQQAEVKETATPQKGQDRRTAPLLFRSLPYRRWLIADTCLDISAGLSAFVMPVVSFIITGSAATAGLLTTVAAVTVGVLQLPGGLLVDRLDRKTLMILTLVGASVIYAGAFVAFAFGLLSFPVLLLITVLNAIRSGLLMNAGEAMLRDLVQGDDLPHALATNEGRSAAVEVGTGPLGGALVGISTALPFLIQSVLAVIGAVVASLIPSPAPRGKRGASATSSQAEATNAAAEVTSGRRTDSSDSCRGTEPSEGAEAESCTDNRGGPPGGGAGRTRPSGLVRLRVALRQSLAGLTWLVHTPVLRRLSFASAPVFSIFNAVLLITMLQMVGEGRGTVSAGIFNSSAAVGVFIGAVIAGPLAGRLPTGKLIAAGMIAPVFAILGVVLVQPLVPRMALVALALIPLPVVSAALGGWVMAQVPEEILGRYFSGLAIISLACSAVVPLTLTTGLERLGYRPTALGALVVMAVLAIVTLWPKAVRGIPAPDKWNLAAADSHGGAG